MKYIVSTYTGDHLKAMELSTDDFEGTLYPAKVSQYSEYGKQVEAVYVYKLTEKAENKLRDAYGDYVWKVLRDTGLTDKFAHSYEDHRKFTDGAVRVSRDVSLKGMRKESSKKDRIREVANDLNQSFDYIKHLERRLVKINERIAFNIADHNRDVLKQLQDGLQWYQPWVDEVDERVGKPNSDLIKEIDALEKELKRKKDELRVNRNARFLAEFEKENWKSPDGDKLPKEHIALCRDVLKNNKGFNKHSVRVFK